MASPLILVSGFGPFLDVERNPSGELALALAENPPLAAEVNGFVLPVSIERSAQEFDAHLAEQPGRALFQLCLGVHRGDYYRIERRARAQLRSERPDIDGVMAASVLLPGPSQLDCSFDCERLSRSLGSAGGKEVRVSEDAGGYVCERIYHHALSREVPALFLHVPPLRCASLEQQLPVVGGLVRALSEQLA